MHRGLRPRALRGAVPRDSIVAMRGLLLLLAGCAATTGGSDPVFFAQEWNACPHVFNEHDARALHEASQRLAPSGACAYEGVYVRGSQVIVAFRTEDGERTAAMLEPSRCVSEPERNAIVAAPYVLRLADGAGTLCPERTGALVAAVREGRLPPPSLVPEQPAEVVVPGSPDAGVSGQ